MPTQRKGRPLVQLAKLVEDVPVKVVIDDVTLLVLKHLGEVRVTQGVCTHRGACLAAGALAGHILTCPRHGWDYDVRSGESPSIEGEGIAMFESWTNEETGAVEVNWTQVLAWQTGRAYAFETL